jgi:maltose/moltooligosaccharide transporter
MESHGQVWWDPLFNGSCQYPKERYGVYMGSLIWWLLFQFFQNVSFGFILKHFLNNDPRLAITFAGVLLLIGAICTLFIKTENKN